MNTKEFIEKLNEVHRDELVDLNQKRQAKSHYIDFTSKFFDNLHTQIEDVLRVSNRIRYFNEEGYYQIAININNVLQVPKLRSERNYDTLQIEYTIRGRQERDTLYVDDGLFTSEKFGLQLSQQLMDQYLDLVFSSVLESNNY